MKAIRTVVETVGGRVPVVVGVGCPGTRMTIEAALNNSFGFGGTNAAILIKKHKA